METSTELSELAAAIKDKGGLAQASGLLGVTAQRLSNWVERGVPIEGCARVHSLLGVPRWVLRPKDWHLIWPELIGAEGAPAIPEPSTQEG